MIIQGFYNLGDHSLKAVQVQCKAKNTDFWNLKRIFRQKKQAIYIWRGTQFFLKGVIISFHF